MTRSERLVSAIARSVTAGGGIYAAFELAFLLDERPSPAFTKFLADCVKRGVLRRVAKGLYESEVTPASPTLALYMIVNKLRPGVLNYISLESELSHIGAISQIPMDRLTVMTKGRKGTFDTHYGCIEFTHTKKPLGSLEHRLYFDESVMMFRATEALARADLISCQRNRHMLVAND